MIDDKSLERLHNSEDFLKFLHYIYGIREWCISQMHDVPTERLLAAKWTHLGHGGNPLRSQVSGAVR